MSDQPRPEVLRHTASVVAAHVGHNPVAPEALPGLIQAVYKALSGLGAEPEPAAPPRTPAVPVRKSIFPDYIVCLEDGAKMTMLKRYLQTRYNLTPAAYRERWGLPADYPMVAPNYASKRSTLARQIGLGRKKADGVPQEEEAVQEDDVQEDDVLQASQEQAEEEAAPAAAAPRRRKRAAKE